ACIPAWRRPRSPSAPASSAPKPASGGRPEAHPAGLPLAPCALKMADRNTLEFFVYSGGSWRSARATVPADWYGNWHRVTGSYDGTTVRLFLDGTPGGQLRWARG